MSEPDTQRDLGHAGGGVRLQLLPGRAGQGGGAGAGVAGDVGQGERGGQVVAHVGLGQRQAARDGRGLAGLGLPGVGLVVEQVQDQAGFHVFQPRGGRARGAVVQGGQEVDQAGHHAAPAGADGVVQA
ncbi:hypothetical protein G6F63_015039 [Rhizopus arrhizus]|nr:hypothetical protein G6F63_015039 [Rhizopus arrhizus]